jgi:hypothetical protein
MKQTELPLGKVRTANVCWTCVYSDYEHKYGGGRKSYGICKLRNSRPIGRINVCPQWEMKRTKKGKRQPAYDARYTDKD